MSLKHPHRAVAFDPTGSAYDDLGYDPDGNRTSRENQTYVYDGPGRLIEALSNGSLDERNVYDEGTTRIIRYAVGESVTQYTGGGLIELHDDGFETTLRRYFSFGGRTIAYDVSPGSRYFRGSDLLASTSNTRRPSLLGGEIRVATAPLERQYQLLRAQQAARDAAIVLSGLTLLAVLACLALSASGGSRVASLTAAAFILTVAPLPSALVLGGGGVFGAGMASAQESVVDPNSMLFYMHGDHLGSVQVVTSGQWDATEGNAIRNNRYHAYGQVRCEENTCSNTVAFNADIKSDPRGFTGHKSTDASGLIYMGARHYDPDLGTFMTFDPAGQFASPYVYGGNSPVMGTDPTGALFGLDWAAIGIAAACGAAFGAYMAFVPAIVKTGDMGAALTSAVIGAAAGALTSAAGSVLYSGADAALRVAAGAIVFGSGGYGAAQSFMNGDVGSGILGAAMLALAAYGVAKSLSSPGAVTIGLVEDTGGGAPAAGETTASRTARFQSHKADAVQQKLPNADILEYQDRLGYYQKVKDNLTVEVMPEGSTRAELAEKLKALNAKGGEEWVSVRGFSYESKGVRSAVIYQQGVEAGGINLSDFGLPGGIRNGTADQVTRLTIRHELGHLSGGPKGGVTSDEGLANAWAFKTIWGRYP